MREPFRDFPFADRGSAMYFRGSTQKKALPESGRPERAREIQTDWGARVLPISSLDAFFRRLLRVSH